MPQVYFDNQTLKAIEKIKEENPEFNLSSFIQKTIKEYTMEDE